MVGVAKWLTHRFVVPAFVGSRPIIHPISSKRIERKFDAFVLSGTSSDRVESGVGILQAKYGYSKDKAQDEYNKFMDDNKQVR